MSADDFAEMMGMVAGRLLGEPNRLLSNAQKLRFGNQGSLAVVIAGAQKGTFYDFETESGGGVLDLIAKVEGCSRGDARTWLQREFGDVSGRPEISGKKTIAAIYPYLDEAGTTAFEVVRYSNPKEFRQRRPDGSGGWIWSIKSVDPIPYRLPELLEAIAQDKPIFVVEGEKDVDRLAALGLVATTNAGGAGKWRPEFAPIFAGADVILIPDNDAAGEEHVNKVACQIKPHARRVRLLRLPDLPEKGDVSSWLDASGTRERLDALAEGAPEWKALKAFRYPRIYFGEEDKGPALSWLVKGVLPSGGLSALFGEPGTGKSFLALDLALHVAHGRDWFGIRCQQAGVAYVTGEGGVGFRSRMKAWRIDRAGTAGAPFVLVPSSINLFDDTQETQLLINEIEAHGEAMGFKVGLIVFDTLARMIGSGDEDRARDMGVIVQRAEAIQSATGAHVLIVHHAGKDKERGMRGSNALLGAVDCAFKVSRFGDSGASRIETAKVKDAADIVPIIFDLRAVAVGVDDEGCSITSCVVDPSVERAAAEGHRKQFSGAAKIALDALREAIDAAGEPSPGGHVPSGVKAVKIDLWREYAYRRGISEGDDVEARRKAFQRARSTLQNGNAVAIWEPLAWLT
jgi:hypothetical protein